MIPESSRGWSPLGAFLPLPLHPASHLPEPCCGLCSISACPAEGGPSGVFPLTPSWLPIPTPLV